MQKNIFGLPQNRLGSPARPGAPKTVVNMVKDGWKYGFGSKPLIAHSVRRSPDGKSSVEAHLNHEMQSGKRKIWECGGLLAFAKQVGCLYATDKEFDQLVKAYEVGGVDAWVNRPQEAVAKAAPAAIGKPKSKAIKKDEA